MRYTFDASGHIVGARIEDQRARDVTYVSDQAGMIVDRDEADGLDRGAGLLSGARGVSA